MVFHAIAAMERAMQSAGSDFAGHGQEDQLVASGGDHRHQRPADATLAGAL
jgi:hypothetical protein